MARWIMILDLFRGVAFLLFSLLSSSVAVYGSHDPELLEESRFWPLNVRVTTEVVGETHGNTVPAGGEWAFLRYENNRCLVDMGHNGIFRFEVDDTDIAERMERIREERTFPFQGLFTFRYTKSFYLPESPEIALKLGALDEYEYFVLFYFEYEKSSESVREIAAVIDSIHAPDSRMDDVSVLLLPENNFRADGLLDSFVEDGLTAPTVLAFWIDPIRHALDHDIATNGNVVVVDKFGKVLGQFSQSDLRDSNDQPSLISRIELFISPHSESRLVHETDS